MGAVRFDSLCNTCAATNISCSVFLRSLSKVGAWFIGWSLVVNNQLARSLMGRRDLRSHVRTNETIPPVGNTVSNSAMKSANRFIWLVHVSSHQPDDEIQQSRDPSTLAVSDNIPV